MLLFNNSFNDSREIQGFKKDEILEIKNKLLQFKNSNTDLGELNDFLKEIFHHEPIELFTEYLKKIEIFVGDFLVHSREELYYNLKLHIIEELEVITNNLNNILANNRNVKRFLKNNEYLDNFSIITKDALERTKILINMIRRNVKKFENLFDDEVYLWIEANKIKNLNYKFNEIKDLVNWEEIVGSINFIQNLHGDESSKKKQKSKEITFHFYELYQYYVENYPNDLPLYSDLIYLLYQNNIIEDYSSADFINVLERKEVVQNLREKMQPIVVSLISSKLGPIINEIKEYDQKEPLDENGKLDFEKIFKQNFSEFLPQIIDYYFTVLDKQLHDMMNNIEETSTGDFVNVIKTYREKIDDIATSIDNVDTWILRFDRYLEPYENITESLKKTISGLNNELIRRKEEYQNYLNSVRDEGLRLEVKKFIDDRIDKVNEMISEYEDKASLIIREELPQLREIRDLLRDYKVKIKSIKSEVYDKLNEYKERDIDTYQIIKNWENNFNRKKQQLTFLLTILLNKIFKSFKDLIDEESILFAEITEITKQAENFEGLPLNFALSAFLADKLSEEELRERIAEMNSKITSLTSSLGLYQVEQAKLEEILTNKVKEKQGIATSDVQCTVCHQNINFAKDKLITCPFCGSTYHYLCVAAWLSKYNSCPMCQNHFLEPFSNLFEND
jgi:hypothetical protein